MISICSDRTAGGMRRPASPRAAAIRFSLAAILILPLLLLSACGGRDSAERKALSMAREQDHDTVAWLSIPGTEIDGPVLRVEDRSDGSFFVQTPYSDETLSDAVTVVYGSSETAGELFGDLQSLYCRNGALEKYGTLRLYTSDGPTEWRVFGVSIWDDRHIPASYLGFADRENIPLFTEEVKSYHTMVRFFDDEVEVLPEDRLLILSTHVADSTDERFLVLAKLAG